MFSLKLEYDSKDVEKYFTNFNLLYKEKGQNLAKAVKKRVNQLMAAKNFGDYRKTGLGKPHFLSGNLKGCVAISLTGNLRLIIMPVIDVSDFKYVDRCEKLIIKGVVDYHGQKEEWIIS